MCKKLIYLTSFVLVVGLVLTNAANAADPDLVGWWKFDEGSGTTVFDSSGYDNHGTFVSDPQWAAGHLGVALGFDGVDDYVEIQDAEELTPENFTIAFWVNPTDMDRVQITMAKKTQANVGGYSFNITSVAVGSRHWVQINGAWANVTFSYTQGVWQHVAITYDGTAIKGHLNGELMATTEAPGSLDNDSGVLRFGAEPRDNVSSYYNGLLDEVLMYSRALTEAEILVVMASGGEPNPYAFGPNPEDGAMLEATWATLSWKAGDSAVSHDVYIGESFDDVNDGAQGTVVGNQATTNLIVGFPGFPISGGLVPGMTYYWRIDEVNDTDPNSPWKGDVWSFWIQPNKAYDPVPANGSKYVLQDVTLSWAAGMGAQVHYVHFGDNFDDVNDAEGGQMLTDTTYTPGTLEVEKTYYWRIDESPDSVVVYKGDVWSFTTVPEVPVHADPNLVAWWTLDESEGTTAMDWSGHGHHGVFVGGPQRIDGYELGALEFDGKDDYVEITDADELTPENLTLAYWIKPVGTSTSNPIAKRDAANNGSYVVNVTMTNTNHWCNVNGSWLKADFGYTFGEWQHVAVTYDGLAITGYLDGKPAATTDAPGALNNDPGVLMFGQDPRGGRFFNGVLDDIVIYDKALSEEEVGMLMLGDPLLAGSPVPRRDAIVDIRDASSLSWSAGDTAASHDVYFGTDRDAVANADNDAPEFQGNQAGTSLSLTGLVKFGGGDYYWRIDEIGTDGTVHAGTIWKFTVPDYLIVDDIESYNDLAEDDPASNRIYLAWIDGFGTTINGAVVGNLDVPLTERGNVHGGLQAMPYSYDNNLKTSEATLTLAKRDWTEQGVMKLSLWFRGDAANAAERMLIALNGNAVVYHDDPATTQLSRWNEWVIDLATFGVDLTNVNTITIGFGTKNSPVAGGTGTMYFDDIRLVR